ncbi:putative colanic acid biosysnthesis UDP-glucose lipid carrier transferase [Mucilaginibacter pineti]|uniref:Putative colanic acid biosysnthesis UDP-glucose lipid carrier transferase n=1 Tax=Mucilaginibacter pineti TaxID=1391627 RepID=A0A1G6Z0I2_9SPHI|nr:sugar transferase [Mucilaginibacter pineti]SDD96108.1 putative colanic acid biosysnthesis UDP-glucose lipid carrier transferase [Mucilaginibacter pineti]
MTIRYAKFLPPITFVCDLILLNISIQCAHLLVFNYFSSEINSSVFLLLVNMAWVTVASLTRNYVIHRPLVLSDSINRILSSLIYHLLAVLAAVYFFKLFEVSRWEMFFTYGLFLGLLCLQRGAIFLILDYIRKKGYNKKHIVLIGDENIANKLKKTFSRHPEYGYHFIDFISQEDLTDCSEEVLIAKLFDKAADEIFVCYKSMHPSFLQRVVDMGDQNRVTVKFVSDLFLNNSFASIINYDNLPVIQLTSKPQLSQKIIIFKRSFDILFSSLVMIIGFPGFILLAIITILTSNGPVFYRQERIGKDHKPFRIYKFRSMYINSEAKGPQLSGDNDPRITKWGRIIRKSRLDELPQFWNVLKGDMSVVGPRPERQFYIEQIVLKSPGYKKLFSLKPGLTSIGQVSYGYAENLEQICHRVRYDMVYLKNISLNTDLNIILRTLQVMVQFKGK